MKRHLRHLVTSGMIALGLALASGPSSLAQSSVVAVPPPQVADYWVSISRQPGGTLVFDGYAPSVAVRDALGLHAGADISWLKLGSGAPSGYDTATAFGLDVLGRLSEGRFALRGSVLSVSGVAATQADFIALHQTLADQVPPGLILAMAEISAPHVESYAFSLRRQPNGNVLLSGFVPKPELEQRLLLAVGARASSTLRFGSGEPLNFEASIDKILPLFALLKEGEIKLADGAWLFSGTPLTAADAESIRATFARDHLSEAGWGLALAAPAPSAPAAPEQTQVASTAPEPVVAEPASAEEVAQPAAEPVEPPCSKLRRKLKSLLHRLARPKPWSSAEPRSQRSPLKTAFSSAQALPFLPRGRRRSSRPWRTRSTTARAPQSMLPATPILTVKPPRTWRCPSRGPKL